MDIDRMSQTGGFLGSTFPIVGRKGETASCASSKNAIAIWKESGYNRDTAKELPEGGRFLNEK